jgi:hypothetical protein
MLLDWREFLAENLDLLWLLMLGWLILSFAFKYFWHRSKGRFFDDPPDSAVIYSEGFASGRSLKSWWTRLGGASNCLKVMLTAERFFVRPIFPFLILGPDLDLIHNVPLKHIESAFHRDGLLQRGIRIRFRLTDGSVREIDIISKKPDQFETALSTLLKLPGS